MLKKEIKGILKSKKSVLIIICLFLIPFIELILNWKSCFLDYYLYPELYKNPFDPNTIFHPSAAAFLAGKSIGHFPQMLFIWILPVYLLILYCDTYITERKNGYNSIIMTKRSRKHVLFSKYTAAFLISFFTVFFSLLLNYLIALFLFRGGKSFGGLESYQGEINSVFTYSLQHPKFTYMMYIIITSFLSGGCGLLCVSLSFIMKNYKYVYLSGFVIWYIQIVYSYSITYLMQPFIEYGLEYMVPGFLIFTGIVLAAILGSYLYKVKQDEI